MHMTFKLFSLIGIAVVLCTHGLNRTGYLVCRLVYTCTHPISHYLTRMLFYCLVI